MTILRIFFVVIPAVKKTKCFLSLQGKCVAMDREPPLSLISMGQMSIAQQTALHFAANQYLESPAPPIMAQSASGLAQTFTTFPPLS
jgi:hypothetical protein